LAIVDKKNPHICEEMEDALDEMFANVEIGGKQSKFGKCPRCKAPFEKSGGCPVMTCTVCQFTYCWVCNMADGPCHNLLGGPIVCELMSKGQGGSVCKQLFNGILTFIFLPLLVVMVAGIFAGVIAGKFVQKTI
jgi:hypothetical protein